MCGLAGFLRKGPATRADSVTTVQRMADALTHRGPDDAGYWHEGEIALGHRRLSIIDLSPQGHQPMASASGRYVIAYNGEIYNHRELRAELASAGGAAWRGHSDTEVLLAAIERWGVDVALEKSNGMFAFALWDRRAKVLYLARDRLGEKPLYYGWMGNTLLFGSELKALRAHPSWKSEVDANVLGLYLRHMYVPSPYCIYRGIFKLTPGHVVSIPTSVPRGEIPPSRAYWSPKDVVERGARDPLDVDDAEAVGTLDQLLREAVLTRMAADVPLGAFLSGGVDSSTVVALMQAQSSRPIRTFTIGFNEARFNEAQHAKAVAKHLGTQHTELYLSPEQALNVIPDLPAMFDEPFADPSQIPTHLVSKLARRHVTVALSGDGGDELFAGYSRYAQARHLWNRIRRVPGAARGIGASAVTLLAPDSWNRVLDGVERVIPARLRGKLAGEKLHRLASLVGSRSPQALYRNLVSHWNPAHVLRDSLEPPTVLSDATRLPRDVGFTSQMMFMDLTSYLPDGVLVKLDRASMAVSLESRVPLLDHRVVELAWRLPGRFRVRDGTSKWLLRQVLYQYVPRSLIERPKMGFGVPIGSWLRGPLREWGEHLIDRRRLEREGLFDAAVVRRQWDDHVSAKRDWSFTLWNVLMFQAWHEADARQRWIAPQAEESPHSLRA